jgi:isoquinoline 1-oxidoreductase beta subunit
MAGSNIVNESRRRFLKHGIGAGAGLTLGVYLPVATAQRAAAGPGKAGGEVIASSDFSPNAFVRIAGDGSVTVIVKHIEFGQGTYTGLPTLVAEELDAAWEQVRVEAAPADASRYNNLFWGSSQGTGGSTALANSYQQLRQAGATARQMLVAAAAQAWGIPAVQITVRQGVIEHADSKRRGGFGEFAALAATLPVPEDVELKTPDRFVYIGKPLPRKDSPEKTDGSAIYTQDIKLPGMLTALVAHPPRFGASVRSFDAARAKAIRGVADVVAIPSGVAVLAQDFWSAKKGRDALTVEWDEGEAFKRGTDEIMAQYRELARRPGTVARHDGDANSALASAHTSLAADYEFPYLAHAAMEPMNCVVKVNAESCEIWNGAQLQTGDQYAVATLLGLPPEQVKINTLFAGGSFGRRANPQSDYVVEAVSVAQAIDGRVPVKLVWTREDDTRAGYYRPMYFHRLQAGLDNQGKLVAWQHRIVGQSIIAGTPFESALVKDGIDATSVEGASNLPYAIPNVAVDLHSPTNPVPVQWWRSVGSTHTAFSIETFIDQLAAAADRDPVEFRREMLSEHPRHLAVMNLAADKAGWGKPMTPGRARGIAVHESFNSFVAQVAEITRGDGGSFTVDRIICAVDCGVAVNPDVIRAQMEGGIGYGLSAALAGTITLKDGIVEQGNFDSYPVLRINQMPAVEVHIVESDAPPTGVGEPGTPVVAPAVANALAAATGSRYYRLPLEIGSSGRPPA